MSHFSIPADKLIDSVKLEAWTHMNTVSSPVPALGAAFIYIRDLGITDAVGLVDPVQMQVLIEDKTVRGEEPKDGAAFIYLDDLMDGFRGTRLEPRSA